MPRFCTAALLIIAMAAGPVGTLVCRVECLGAAAVAVHAPGPCAHHGGSPELTLRADATPCDERVGPAAVKPERFEPSSPALAASVSALWGPRHHAPSTVALAPSRPLTRLAFVGTDLPLRI